MRRVREKEAKSDKPAVKSLTKKQKKEEVSDWIENHSMPENASNLTALGLCVHLLDEYGYKESGLLLTLLCCFTHFLGFLFAVLGNNCPLSIVRA